MVGNFPNIKQSLESAFEEWNHNPANRITRTINGIEYEFPRIKDESQFLTAPKSLWLPPKRYRRVEPQWAGLHRMMPNWFDAQPADQIKDERPMTFQEILTIQPVQGGPARYKLDGFICHLGQTPDSGHYISYRLGKDDEGREAWFEMNDSVVTRISDAQMRAVLPTAYIPHYSRIED
jgi:ubiquitin C-terminal hydrolase